MRTRLLIGLLTVLPACAPTGQAYAPRDSSRITSVEIERTQVSTAHELVERLRPGWLRTRGQSSMLLASPIRVYLNGAPYGELAALSQIPVNDIRLIERLGASEATRRFGTDHANGAILISTR